MPGRARSRRLWTFWTVGALAAAGPAAAQHQSDSIRISRDAHDLAWLAAGTAVSLTLKELGMRSRDAALLGSVGLVTAVKLVECARLCGRENWPARVVLRDAVYDIVLASGVAPVLIGRRKGWEAGLLAGAMWVGTVLVLREARWNSP